METERNLETVDLLTERWNAGDTEGVLEFYDDDIVMVTSPSWPEQRDVVGKDAVRGWMHEWRALWDVSELHSHDVRANGDKVAARGAWESRGRVSGVEGVLPFSMLLTLRDGKVVRVEWFDDHDDALRAAGL
jgi:ketosteroid isomerase-like protein